MTNSSFLLNSIVNRIERTIDIGFLPKVWPEVNDTTNKVYFQGIDYVENFQETNVDISQQDLQKINSYTKNIRIGSR